MNRCTPFQPLLLPNVPHEKQRQDFEFFIFKPHERRRRRRRNTLQQKSPLPLWMETKPEVKNLQEPVIKYHSHPYTMVEESQLSTCFCSLAFNQFFFSSRRSPRCRSPRTGCWWRRCRIWGRFRAAGGDFLRGTTLSGLLFLIAPSVRFPTVLIPVAIHPHVDDLWPPCESNIL